jgi:hypothetical protein
MNPSATSPMLADDKGQIRKQRAQDTTCRHNHWDDARVGIRYGKRLIADCQRRDA